MAYTKVSTIITDGNSYNYGSGGNPDAWRYFFETFLPTVGWTVTLTDDNSANTPSGTGNHWYFLKKTLTFTDGTTDTISFALRVELGARRHQWYAWDGVLATNDNTDPQYGRGSNIGTLHTSSFLSTGAGTWDIWKDANSDSYVWLKNGKFHASWLPNGNWVRQDNVHIVDTLFNHDLLMPMYHNKDTMCSYGTNMTGFRAALPIDTPNSTKLTNYISVETGQSKGVWLGTSNDILMRASAVQFDRDQNPELLKVGTSAPYDYYHGMTDNSGGKGLYFNFGTTDPGY